MNTYEKLELLKWVLILALIITVYILFQLQMA